MTSNMIYIVALGVGFKCPRKIHLNTQCPPSPRFFYLRLALLCYSYIQGDGPYLRPSKSSHDLCSRKLKVFPLLANVKQKKFNNYKWFSTIGAVERSDNPEGKVVMRLA